jgi:hypothetical protein
VTEDDNSHGIIDSESAGGGGAFETDDPDGGDGGIDTPLSPSGPIGPSS